MSITANNTVQFGSVFKPDDYTQGKRISDQWFSRFVILLRKAFTRVNQHP